MPAAVEHHHGSRLDTAALLVELVLHEGANRRNARPKTNHDHWSDVVLRELERTADDRTGHLAAHRHVLDELRAGTCLHSTGRLGFPLVDDDRELNRLRAVACVRGDGVDARLDHGEHRDQLLQRHLRAGVLLHDIEEGGALVDQRGPGCIARPGAESPQSLGICVVGEAGQLRHKGPGRTTKEVDHVRQNLANGHALVKAATVSLRYIPDALHADNLVAVQIQELECFIHVLWQVLRVKSDGIAEVKRKVNALEAQCKVADVALVVIGGEASVLRHRQQLRSGRDHGSCDGSSILVVLHLEERSLRPAIVDGLRGFDRGPELWKPGRKSGLPLVLVAVIADAHVQDASSA
mmetsp:Transcript_56737/g.135365  ORF Transcript_56737/g.135365 Transcript_56737/m.135365 type:complete len:351 (-) Transcript_56737:755-1807(-)